MNKRSGRRVACELAGVMLVAVLSGCGQESGRAVAESSRTSSAAELAPRNPVGSWASSAKGSILIPLGDGFVYESMEDGAGAPIDGRKANPATTAAFIPSIRIVDQTGDRLLKRGAISPAVSATGAVAYLKLDRASVPSNAGANPDAITGTVVVRDGVGRPERSIGITGAVRPVAWAGNTLVLERHDPTTGLVVTTDLVLGNASVASRPGLFEAVRSDARAVFVSDGSGARNLLVSVDAVTGAETGALSVRDYATAVGQAVPAEGTPLAESEVRSLPASRVHGIGRTLGLSVGTGALFLDETSLAVVAYQPFPLEGGEFFETGTTSVLGSHLEINGTRFTTPPYPEFTASDTIQSAQAKYEKYQRDAQALRLPTRYRCSAKSGCAVAEAPISSAAQSWNPSR